MHDPSVQYEKLFTSTPYIRGKASSPFALQALQYAPGQMALDLGCGEGQDAVAFAQKGFTVKALDASRTAISHAQALATAQDISITWVCADALAFQHWEGEYDFIYADGFLHFFDNDTLTSIIAMMQARTQVSGINAIGVFDQRTSEMERINLSNWGIRCDCTAVIEDFYANWTVLKGEKFISKRKNGEIRGITHWIFKNVGASGGV